MICQVGGSQTYLALESQQLPNCGRFSTTCEKVHLTKDLALSNIKIENWFTQQNKGLAIVLIKVSIGVSSFAVSVTMVKEMVRC